MGLVHCLLLCGRSHTCSTTLAAPCQERRSGQIRYLRTTQQLMAATRDIQSVPFLPKPRFTAAAPPAGERADGRSAVEFRPSCARAWPPLCKSPCEQAT